MKKSLMSLGVVAAMAVGGAANAAFWSITNAQIGASPVTGGPSFTIGAAANTSWVGGGDAGERNTLDGANLASVQALFTPAANTLTYFSFYKNSVGFFGVAYSNTTAGNVGLMVDFTGLNQATEGVYVAGGTGGTYDANFGLGKFSGGVTVAAGETLYIVLGGFADQNNPDLQGNVQFNSATAVSYLSYNHAGGVYSQVASGNGLTSNMQFAVFTIPVPAPALLAGLGLAGALALRRRMK